MSLVVRPLRVVGELAVHELGAAQRRQPQLADPGVAFLEHCRSPIGSHGDDQLRHWAGRSAIEGGPGDAVLGHRHAREEGRDILVAGM